MPHGTHFPFVAMASRCELHLAGLPAQRLASAARRAQAEVLRIEAKYSRYRVDSVVSRINAAAGQPAPVALDDETAHLLAFAGQLHALSAGLFDISSGVLRRAWDFKAGQPPTPQQLQAVLPLVGWGRVELTGASVRLPSAGMELDFGGFGKEYAADRAATLLLAEGVQHGYVNLGGDIRLLGPQPDGQPWRFAIQHPRQADASLAHVALSHGALATSGDYERYFVHQGQRYCHVLDPTSGWPARAWQSVSVTQPACVAAGALCTVAMLKGAQALDFLQQQAAAYLAVDASGALHHQGL